MSEDINTLTSFFKENIKFNWEVQVSRINGVGGYAITFSNIDCLTPSDLEEIESLLHIKALKTLFYRLEPAHNYLRLTFIVYQLPHKNFITEK
ncbi:MAG: hypothetical protein QXT31_03415 [Candidatus Bathyarchaeia archaeon]